MFFNETINFSDWNIPIKVIGSYETSLQLQGDSLIMVKCYLIN